MSSSNKYRHLVDDFGSEHDPKSSIGRRLNLTNVLSHERKM